MVPNGLLGAGGQQALWECRELRLIQRRERSIQQAVLLPPSLFSPSALPVQLKSGQRAAGMSLLSQGQLYYS